MQCRPCARIRQVHRVPDSVLLTSSFVSCVAGFGWLALSMDVHWRQVREGAGPSSRSRLLLRLFGAIALSVSLMLCLAVDHASMASLVWVMTLAAAALTVAFTLSSRPRCLAPLITWIPAARSGAG